MSFEFRTTAVVLAVSAAWPAFANPELPEVVVIATRQETRVNALVSDVTVINRDAIRRAGPSSTLGELLARQPGIEYNRAGPRGALETVFIRGTNSGHALVLVDGMRIGSATLASLPMQQIERVEILRGSASSLYGSDAVGGVINIHTHSKDPSRLEVELGGGNHGTHAASIASGGRTEEWSWHVRAAESGTDGISAISDKSHPSFNSDEDGYNQKNLSAGLEYRFSSEAGIGLQHFVNSADNRYDSNRLDSSWSPIDANLDWQGYSRVVANTIYGFMQPAPAWKARVQLANSVDETTSSPSYTVGVAEDRYKTERDLLSWQNDVRLPLGAALVLLERLEESVSTSPETFATTQRNINSVTLGWNANEGNHRWQTSVRHDSNSQYGDEDTYTLGYGYQMNQDWRISGSTGTAFKAPTFNDLYWPGFGNPDLKPESSLNKEISLTRETTSQTSTLTLFHNEIEDMIVTAETFPGSGFYMPLNVGEARLQGITMSHEERWGNWRFNAIANFQDAEDKRTGNRLPRRAQEFGLLAADWESGVWGLGAEFTFAGDRYDDLANTTSLGGYALVNLRGSYRVDTATTLFARIDNLFDRDYIQAAGYATQGFAVFAGLRYEMK